MPYPKIINLVMLVTTLFGCASVPQQQCPAGTLNMPDCPPADAVVDKTIDDIYEIRTWVPPSKLTVDPIKLGEEAQIPINSARAKIIGPTHDDALNSLAAKIWLIENAQHTVDVTYYIFKADIVGYSVLGALCDAVKRGVDVRIMVDSIGSFSLGHSELRAIETCAADAGFMRNADGELTTKKARVQVVIFNAITRFKFNRRSHDKLLIVDGAFPDKAVVMTGGRNISLDYYGINEDGSEDPDAFRDLEIIILNKGFVLAEIEWPCSGESKSQKIDIISVHLYFSRQSVREKQISEILELLSARMNPTIIMGDFNSEWLAEVTGIHKLVTESHFVTYEPEGDNHNSYKNKRLDWILLTRDMEFVNYRVLPDTLSDHAMVMADIHFKAVSDKVTN